MTQQKSFDGNRSLWLPTEKNVSGALKPYGLIVNNMKWQTEAGCVPTMEIGCAFHPAYVGKTNETPTHDYLAHWPSDLFRMMNAFGDINGQKKPDRKAYDNDLVPIRIQKNGPAMIVFWRDGTKTIVRRGEDEPDSDYAAFTAALARKIYGSNSAVKRIVSTVEYQKKQKEQKEYPEQKSNALDALQRVAEKFGMTAEEAFQKIKEAQKD